MARQKQADRPSMRQCERPIGDMASELAAVREYIPAHNVHAQRALALIAGLPPATAYQLAEQLLWAAGYSVPAVRMRECALAGRL
jgi:hypothetical protein